MNFNVVLSPGAHEGDHVDDLKHQLVSHGHDVQVVRDRFLPRPFVNVFMESAVTSARIAALARDHVLVCLVTELPTLVTKRSFVWNYRTDDAWIRRAEDFIALAPRLTAAWCYAASAARVIGRYCPAADVEVAHRSDVSTIEPSNDFCFFGALTPRRSRIIEEVAKRYSVDVISHDSSLPERDARVRRSRVVLDVMQFDWWPMVSSMRCAIALRCGRPVIAEHRSGPAASRWRRIVRFAREDRFVDDAAEVLANWRSEHERQNAAFARLDAGMERALKLVPLMPTIECVDVQQAQEAQVLITSHVVSHNAFAPAPILVGSLDGINVIDWRGLAYAIPQSMGTVDLHRIDLSRCPAILTYPSAEAAFRAIRPWP